MKNKVVIIFFLFVAACTLKKQAEYILPKDLTKEKEKSFIKQFKKGKTLYSITCAKCHDKEVNGKIVMPDFNPLQLKEYKIRLGNKEHSKNLHEKDLPEEELNDIMFFLMYKKPASAKK